MTLALPLVLALVVGPCSAAAGACSGAHAVADAGSHRRGLWLASYGVFVVALARNVRVLLSW